MSSNLVFALYYIYAMLVVAIFSYAVFYLGNSGWYFMLCLLLLQIQPTRKNE